MDRPFICVTVNLQQKQHLRTTQEMVNISAIATQVSDWGSSVPGRNAAMWRGM